MAEAYRVGIALSLAGNHIDALQLLARNLFHVHGQVGQLQTAFSRLGLAIGGSIGLFVGDRLIRGIQHFIDKTKELSREMSNIRILNTYTGPYSTEGGISALERQFYDTARRVPGTSQSDIAGVFGRITSIIGGQEATRVMEPLARFGVAMGAGTGKGFSATDMQNVVQFALQTGRLTDPKTHEYSEDRFTKFLDMTYKMMAATEFRIGPSQLLAMSTRGGVPLRGMTPEGLMGMAIIGQAMGPSQAGTAVTSLYQQTVGARMTQQTAAEWMRLGLLHPGEAPGLDHGAAGTPHHLRMHGAPHRIPGAGMGRGRNVQGMLTAAARARLGAEIGPDPLMYMAGTVLPAMIAAGITEPEAQMQELFTLGGRQTTQRFMAEEIQDFQRIIGERQRMQGAMGVGDATGVLASHSVPYNLGAMQKAWEDLLQTVSGPNSANEIWALQKLTGGLRYMQEVVKGMDPGVLSAIGIGLAGVGAALLTAGGTALFLAMGPAGWIVGGLTALGLALATVDWKNKLQEIGEGLQALWAKIKLDWDTFKEAIFGKTPAPWHPPMVLPPGGTTFDPATGRMLSPTAPTGAAPGLPAFPGRGNRRTIFDPATGRMISPTSPGGALGGPNLGSGGANFMTGSLPGAGDLTHITAAGHAMTVNAAAAADMGGFVSGLAEAGAPITSLGTHNIRKIHGSNRWSQHAYGTAVDIDQSARNVVSPAFQAWANAHPDVIRKLMTQHHMRSGGDWKNPDFGHFEWGGPEGTVRKPMVPDAKDKGAGMEMPVYLDGAKIAHATMKQMIAGMNSGPGGSRLPDYTNARPQPV